MQSNGSKKRQALIDRLEKEKAKRINREQKRFAKMVLQYLSQNILTDGDQLKQTTKNYTIIGALDVLQNDFEKKYIIPLLKWFAKSLTEILEANKNYFGDLSESITNKIDRTFRNRVGLTKSGSIKKGGFLSNAGKITTSITQIKNIAVRGVTNRIDKREFEQGITIFINPKEKEGILEKELSTKTKDLFSVIDRETGNNLAIDLGLNFAIYQGGVIKTSRPFCLERNNKVYSKTEIASWASIEFQGKSTPYNPFIDCGGYNCRHQLDWISDELAYALRPDLKNI